MYCIGNEIILLWLILVVTCYFGLVFEFMLREKKNVQIFFKLFDKKTF